MEPFEDENPFSTADPPLSSASSNSHVDVSAPSSPPNRTVTLPSSPPRLSIQTPSLRSGFPSQGSGHSPRPQTSKSDFCCIRDQWLHSGEDVEITVSLSCSSSYFPSGIKELTLVSIDTYSQITDALKTSEHSTSPYITYIIRSGVSPRQRILGKS
jgi:sorting nexin-41/42